MPSLKPTNYNQIQRSCVIQSLLKLCSEGLLTEAVKSLNNLASKGLRLDTRSLAFLLQACSKYRSLKEGKWVHVHMNYTGRKRPGTFLSNQLIYMYSECGDWVGARRVFDKMSLRNLYSWNNMLSGYAKLRMMKPARSLFDQMQEKDVVSWNTMVIGYAQDGNCGEALKLYKELTMLNIRLNEFSFSGVLTVCVKTKELGLTRQVHCQVFGIGFLSNLVLCSSMIDCYAKCGEMSDARKLFDEMPKRDVLAWTTMVSGYAKWGDMELARGLFDDMPEKNPVSWTSLISGYSRNSSGHEALELFTDMMARGVKPNQFTFSSALCACASVASIKNGKQIHAFLIRTCFTPNAIVVSSLIDMYSKCGDLGLGLLVFKLMGSKHHDTILWNTMISAMAQHGHGEAAIELFSNMVRAKVKPDRITFVIILNACSHSGLVQEGRHFFNTLMHEHNIVPDHEHYACLIDLLGRAGCFDEMVNELKKMPFKPDARVWKALLGVCRIHGNIELGRKVAQRFIELEPRSSVGYVLLAGIYAASGRWESVAKVRKIMNKRDVRKERGVSWLENENKLHSFMVSDKSHTSNDEIESVLEILATQMEDDDDSFPDS
ncbi:pentatricopeptide repeat-containing protein At2g21090 [Cynara cardunculus var. scolymus]|uniref:Pentatricopeptide repeat-containing protein n=1 Tax=Cynara cardunculus var. scolymus TaxID=59895 RepID=A0A103Y7S0_CYNCS|nr:pentatricopeptide repeat-containing protein At2g21090 [Cynara cardunculus var. scolymus]XP_024991639.1 pentatricopeptide repeat-containing protein At2g21090 [Cynara cardunculus var. scolymus]KVI04086.1 Pentatricopeptide repeat-containing protein [Cynara cardunculus var. scolymus]